MTRAYYNEHDKYAAQWLRNLIEAGHIAAGDVDERSIEDVRPGDLAGYIQCHFFAGVGVWSHALRRAGWSDNKPVWTGSCPCQPFSTAGKGDGVVDERHLWPAWFHLINQCRPRIIFGEQVDAAIKHGWLDLVYDDLEGLGYSVGAASVPAAGVGAPHIRQRLWFVADSNEQQQHWRGNKRSRRRGELAVGHSMGNTIGAGLEGFARYGGNGACSIGPTPEANPWNNPDWVECRDGKRRPVEPGAFPLAHGATARVGRLRAYGNAIVPQVAEQIIRAYIEGKL